MTPNNFDWTRTHDNFPYPLLTTSGDWQLHKEGKVCYTIEKLPILLDIEL